jgi:hypothetical protein
MCCRKKEEGMCTKCMRLSFNIGLLTGFLTFMGLPILHSYIATWNFLIQPSQWSLLKGVGNCFIGLFAVLYLSASLIILWRFYQKRRLCRMDNCSFYIFTVGILVLATVGQDYIHKAKLAHRDDFSYSCAQLALADYATPDSSFLADMNQVYKNANDLLCTADCPCGLRPFMRDDSWMKDKPTEVTPADDTPADTIDETPADDTPANDTSPADEEADKNADSPEGVEDGGARNLAPVTD